MLSIELLSIIALILSFMFVYWLLFSDTDTSNFKAFFKIHYQEKVVRIDNNFGRGTWKKFIKNDLKETQQTIKKVLSRKTITSDEYYKLIDLVDEMERYIENSVEHSPTEELDIELEVLRKINTLNPQKNKKVSQLNQPTARKCRLKIGRDLQHEATTFYFGVARNKKRDYYYSIYHVRFNDLESDVHTLLYCIREDISKDIEDKILFEGYSSRSKKLFYELFLHLSNQEVLQVEELNKEETKVFIEGLTEIFHEYPELYLYFE